MGVTSRAMIVEIESQNPPPPIYIKREDVVVLKETGEYITILKGGITNERIKNARRLKI